MERLDNTLTPLLGRLMMAAIFIWSGFGKLVQQAGTIGYMAKTGLPMPQAVYWVAVGIELGGGILIALGLFTRPVAAVLAIWCLATAAIVHLHPSDIEQMINAYKNLAMAGGFLYVAAYGAGLWSVDAARRPIRGPLAV